MDIVSINPATGNAIKSFHPLSASQLDEKLCKAASSFHSYRRTSIAQRASLMRCAAEILDNEKESFGRLMTSEMGKTLQAAIAESEKCAWVCRYFAESAECWLRSADETPFGLGPACGRTIPPNSSLSSAKSKQVPRSPTKWWRRIPACRLAALSIPDTEGNSAGTAFGNSPTSSP